MTSSDATPRTGATSAEGLFVLGAVSQYLGAAIAVGLFDSLATTTVAWLRILAGAVVVLALARPWRRHWSRQELAWSVAFGATLALMNVLIYLAIDRLPLGTAVAIEFSGPVAVAAIGSRGRRGLIALALAAGGVLLLSDVEAGTPTVGVLCALGAGVAWAGYIILGHRVARNGSAFDGLAIAMGVAAAAVAIVGIPGLGPIADDPRLLVPALMAGVLSSAVPYVIDQLVLAGVTRDRFALLQALLPVYAALIGLIALQQVPGPMEVAGIALVVAALTVHR